MLSNCSRNYCAYNQPQSPTTGSCVCNATFTGSHCETRRCGMYGDVAGSGNCTCFGVMRLSALTGTCTAHVCGRRGYPVAGTWCTCYAGNRLVQTDPVCQCQKACSVHGRYNATADVCVCEVGFAGDLCELRVQQLLPVSEQWQTLMRLLFVTALVAVLFLQSVAVHVRTDHLAQATERPKALVFLEKSKVA